MWHGEFLNDYPTHAEALLKRWLPEAPRYAYVKRIAVLR